MGKPVSFFTCKVFTHFIHCLSLELPPTWNTGKKWQFPINATSSSSSVWTWETLEYNLFRSPLQLHHKPPLAKPWSYKRLVLFSTEQKIRFFFAAWHPAHATRAACRWGTGPTPEHGRSPGAAPRGGNGPPHAAASPAAAQPSPAPPLRSQPRGGGRREGRGEAPIPGLPAAERCQGAGPRLRAPPHRSPAWACRCRSPSSARPAGTLASDKPLTPLPPSSRLPQGAGLRRRAGCSGARDGPRRHLVASSVRARRAEVGALPWFCVQ